MKLRVLWALLLAFGLSMVSVASADIIANFDDATATDPDGYAGATGGGWSGGWIVAKSQASATATWMTTTTGGYAAFDADNDKYLRLKTTYSGSGKGAVMRNYMHANGDVDFTQDYTIAFSFRADDLTTFATSSDGFWFFTDPASSGTTQNYGPSVNSTYQIRATGNNPQWQFISGDNAGSNVATLSTGISLVQGTIYDFVVTMHPATMTYDATVSDGVNSYSSKTDFPDGLGWRGNVNGKYLTFSEREGNTGSVTMSIDNIRIAQVPEPSTLILLASALLGLLIWRKK